MNDTRSTRSHSFARNSLALAVATALLAACGGGGDGGPGTAVNSAAPVAPSGPTTAPVVPPTDAEAMRFLTQATMGPSTADVARLKQQGYDAWLEEQFAKARTSHLDFVISEIGLDGAAGDDRPVWLEVLDCLHRQDVDLRAVFSQRFPDRIGDAGGRTIPAGISHQDFFAHPVLLNLNYFPVEPLRPM